MLLGITQRDVQHQFGNRDCLEKDYVSYFEDFGTTLIPISNRSKNAESYFALPLQGLVLSGGNNIAPYLYGSKELPEKDCSIDRDSTEQSLVRLAIKKKLPILGICRGMQFINAYFGGTIETRLGEGHVATEHEINVSGFNGRKKENFKVNSYHAQGLKDTDLSAELRTFAKSEDGVIEGVYHPKLPIAGIQWHPERKSPNKSLNTKLVKSFLERKLFWH
jgi:N5-(cytidine 5'-diphosphoramidyl)-L-glutamine hydrolase